MALLHQFNDLTLGKNGACDVETAVLALHGTIDIQLVVQPLVRLAAYKGVLATKILIGDTTNQDLLISNSVVHREWVMPSILSERPKEQSVLSNLHNRI